MLYLTNFSTLRCDFRLAARNQSVNETLPGIQFPGFSKRDCPGFNVPVCQREIARDSMFRSAGPPQLSRGSTKFDQIQLRGMTRIMAGIMSAVGNILTLTMRKPIKKTMRPPQALKSPIISGVVIG